MKILAFSDLHRDTEITKEIVRASKSADILIGAGDFAIQGEGAMDTLDILAKSEKPTIVVHGNHDDPDEMFERCARAKNLHFLHGNELSIDDVTFFGLGGEVPSRNSFEWNSAETENAASDLLATCPQNAVLVTHTPPFGLADLQTDGTHEGSLAIRAALSKTEPRLLLCGHIHNAWGTSGHLGAVPVHNLGPTLNWFEL